MFNQDEKKILITGARSKLADPLIKHFIDKGKDVAIISKNKIDLKYKNIKIYTIDLTKDINIDFSPDLIIHMAAYVPYNFENNISDEEVYTKNIVPCVKILEFAIKNQVKNFILISSIDVYGKIEKDIIYETDVCKPENVYGLAKLACEKISYTFSHIYNLNVSILRFGPIIGPNMSKNLKIYKMINRLINGKKIKVDNPNSLVSFLSEDIASDAIIRACKKKFKYSIFNITGDRLEIIELFKCFLNEKNKHNLNVEKEHITRKKLIISNEKAKMTLGWRPNYNFKDIASSFLQFNKNI